MNKRHKCKIKRYDLKKLDTDPQSYRSLILANKMKVFLTSYPTTDQSKVTMDVNIGSMCDPDDLPGLAHFCEHMLFLGTKKYPQQNDFYVYMSQNGGKENATTHLDHTTYNFKISPEKFEGALDRFAQFFLEPLFKETLIDSELNIINSEHELYLADDQWRLKQLERSFANPDHPFSKFSTGNRETLDIIPKEKGINVRNRLIEFYEKYYSANIMTLYVLGKESLDELENMVTKYFSGVKNNKVEIPVWPDHPFNDVHFSTIWYVVPIKDIRYLYASFPLPETQHHWYLSISYISYLLEYKGEGSILSALRARSWCNSLKTCIRTEAKNLSFFDINVDLTEEGIKHIEDIVQVMFQYISMLRFEGQIEWIYDQYRKFVTMKMIKPNVEMVNPEAFHAVRKLQEDPMNMTFYEEHAGCNWQSVLIKTILEYLTPQNIRIYVLAKAYESIANETERWYGTKYKKEKVSKETMNMWNLAMDLKLPSKNNFIPTTFHYKLQTAFVGKDFPIILKDTLFARLWYKKDEDYIVAETTMIFNFVSPLVYMDPLNYNLTELFVHLVCDSLYQYTYDAELVGLEWSLINSQYGITLTISGYDHKPILLEKIIDRLINFKIDPKRFELLKENYIRDLKNFDAKQPNKQVKYYLEALLSEAFWLKNELLKTAVYISVDRLEQFVQELFSKVHMECLIYGNMIPKDAINTVELIESKFKTEIFHIPLLQKQLKLYRGIKLEDGCNFLFEVENKWYKSFYIMVYFAIGLQSTESNMLLKLLLQIIEGPCYYTLRTEEKLGYLVSSDIHKTNGTQGLQIIVQSDQHPQHVEKRIDSFLDSMLDHISTISQEQFEEYKKAIKVSIKPIFFKDYSTLYWNEIKSQQYNFDRVNIEVAYLDTITRQQLLNFYEKNIHSKCTRRKLSIHVIPTTMLAEKNSFNYTRGEYIDWKTNEDIKKIDGIMSFKNSQALYPLLKPIEESFLKKGVII